MNSSNRADGFTPAAISNAAEMPRPTTSAQARISACIQGDMCCRSSRLSRPSRQRWTAALPSGAAALPAAGAACSSMVHHDAADGLAIGRRREFGGDAAAGHDADAIGEIEHLVEVVADQQDGGAGRAGFQKALVHGGAGAHVEAAAWAVGDD